MQSGPQRTRSFETQGSRSLSRKLCRVNGAMLAFAAGTSFLCAALPVDLHSSPPRGEH